MYLITRDGTVIVKTLERILATYEIKPDSAGRLANGELIFDYGEDGADVDWDTSEAVDGSYLLDADGDAYSEADCALGDEQDLELVEQAIKLASGELA